MTKNDDRHVYNLVVGRPVYTIAVFTSTFDETARFCSHASSVCISRISTLLAQFARRILVVRMALWTISWIAMPESCTVHTRTALPASPWCVSIKLMEKRRFLFVARAHTVAFDIDDIYWRESPRWQADRNNNSKPTIMTLHYSIDTTRAKRLRWKRKIKRVKRKTADVHEGVYT